MTVFSFLDQFGPVKALRVENYDSNPQSNVTPYEADVVSVRFR